MICFDRDLTVQCNRKSIIQMTGAKDCRVKSRSLDEKHLPINFAEENVKYAEIIVRILVLITWSEIMCGTPSTTEPLIHEIVTI